MIFRDISNREPRTRWVVSISPEKQLIIAFDVTSQLGYMKRLAEKW